MLTNKYAEGYPGRRYYGGCQFVDVAEKLAIERAKQLFGCGFANVQPHSGRQANQAVFLALLQARRHLHGPRPRRRRPPDPRLAGQHVGQVVQRRAATACAATTSCIDMDEVERLAHEHKPKLIIAGGSAYPRVIDFAALPRDRRRGRRLSSWSTWRISPASSPAARIPTPFPHAHVVTTTTHKTLRGPRGGMILTNDEDDRQEDQLGGLPGPAGRPADARHRRQGGRLRRGAAARVQGLRPARGRERQGARRDAESRAASTSSPAAPTPT